MRELFAEMAKYGCVAQCVQRGYANGEWYTQESALADIGGAMYRRMRMNRAAGKESRIAESWKRELEDAKTFLNETLNNVRAR